MTLLERLEILGVIKNLGGGGTLTIRPADVHGVREAVLECRKEKTPVMVEVEGLPPVPMWSYREPSAANANTAARVFFDLGALRNLTLDRESHLVTAEAGITVSDLESEVSRRGFTLGLHETPSTPLGAWLALAEPGPACRRSSPGWSPVAGLEAVLHEGSVVRTTVTPRTATGPDPKALLIGSNGRLGVITRATLRIYPSAERKREVLAFADAAVAVGTVVEALGRDLIPDAFGLLDGGDSETVVTWDMHGDPEMVAMVSLTLEELCNLNGGRRLSSLAAGGDRLTEKERNGARSCVADGAAGPVEIRAAAKGANGNGKTMIAIGFGCRWSRVVLVRRALLNALGPSARLHLERALPEGACGIACLPSNQVETARTSIRKAGGWLTGDEGGDDWIDGVAGVLLGDDDEGA